MLLSDIVNYMILTSQRLILKTLLKSQLLNHLLKELFQYYINTVDSCELNRTIIDSLHKICSSELVSESAQDGTQNNATENAT